MIKKESNLSVKKKEKKIGGNKTHRLQFKRKKLLQFKRKKNFKEKKHLVQEKKL